MSRDVDACSEFVAHDPSVRDYADTSPTTLGRRVQGDGVEVVS